MARGWHGRRGQRPSYLAATAPAQPEGEARPLGDNRVAGKSPEGSQQLGHQALNLSRPFMVRSRESTVVCLSRLRHLPVSASITLPRRADSLMSKLVSIRPRRLAGELAVAPLTLDEGYKRSTRTVDSSGDRDSRSELTKLIGEMAVGGVAGLATGGPVGGAVGAGAPLGVRAFIRVAGEFKERVLGHREAYRIVNVVRLAKAKYEKNIAGGAQLRDDDFFLQDEATGRSSAEEIVEGTLLAAQREHEERKIPYYANLIANLPFEPAIDRYTANLLLRTAQELSYRQLCLLALVAKKDRHVLPSTSNPVSSIGWEAWSVKEELDDLGYGKRELVLAVHHGPGLPTNIGVPADLELKTGGTALYELMGLGEIPNSELYKLSSVLREWAGVNTPGD
jgi:hypothetical protein